MIDQSKKYLFKLVAVPEISPKVEVTIINTSFRSTCGGEKSHTEEYPGNITSLK
jgi:hypothetical protein